MFNKIFLDLARNNQIFFQDTATPTMSGIIDLHQHVFFFIIFIFIVVAFQIFDVLSFFRIDNLKISSVFSIQDNSKLFSLYFNNNIYNFKDDFLVQQIIYLFFKRHLYTHVLDRFFQKNGIFITSYVRTKYYFQLLKGTDLEFVNQLKILNLLKNLPLLTSNKELRKKLIIELLNLFFIVDLNKTEKNKFKIFNSIFTLTFAGFSLFKNFENNLKKALIKMSLVSKIHKFNHNTIVETIWTLIPIAIVLAIAIPSFVLMYALDAALDGVITIKAIGHQWYWSYECEFPDVLGYLDDELDINAETTNMINIHFDSYMIYTDQLKEGEIRLLEVDKALFLPFRVPVDIVITSVDVIHSWAVPSLGVKVDAVPGRLNHIGVFIERKGIFFGQCSELCGVNHGFMPIKVVAVSYADYINYCYAIFASSAENLDNLLKVSKFF
jgi:cytochrome c oxidase subunit 2